MMESVTFALAAVCSLKKHTRSHTQANKGHYWVSVPIIWEILECIFLFLRGTSLMAYQTDPLSATTSHMKADLSPAASLIF